MCLSFGMFATCHYTFSFFFSFFFVLHQNDNFLLLFLLCRHIIFFNGCLNHLNIDKEIKKKHLHLNCHYDIIRSAVARCLQQISQNIQNSIFARRGSMRKWFLPNDRQKHSFNSVKKITFSYQKINIFKNLKK